MSDGIGLGAFGRRRRRRGLFGRHDPDEICTDGRKSENRDGDQLQPDV